jgi:hypothetical protein
MAERVDVDYWFEHREGGACDQCDRVVPHRWTLLPGTMEEPPTFCLACWQTIAAAIEALSPLASRRLESLERDVAELKRALFEQRRAIDELERRHHA